MTSLLSRRAEDYINDLRFPELATSSTHDASTPLRLAEGKTAAVLAGDEAEAAMYWKAETIRSVQRGFIEAFEHLRGGEYYKGWCQLERCEIQLELLLQHFVPSPSDEHRLALIGRMIQRWQELFPYRAFFSPEILKKRIVCSICKSRVTPRTDCGHVKGRIYRGESCHHIIKQAEILSISLVENPVQRYSVAFFSGPDGSQVDHYDYGNVKFVADRAQSAFQEWHSEIGKRMVPAKLAEHLTEDDHCPCLSGKTFGTCCKGAQTITVPHLQISFIGGTPNPSLPTNELHFKT